MFGEFGVIVEFDDDVVSVREYDVVALIVFVDDGFDVCTTDFGGSIDVSDETDGFDFSVDV